MIERYAESNHNRPPHPGFTGRPTSICIATVALLLLSMAAPSCFADVIYDFSGFQSVRTFGQVVATWTDGSGNWSNPANWSTNPAVPNNGGGTFYDAVINGTASDTIVFDASGTAINDLTIGFFDTFKDNGRSPTLTIGDPTFAGSGNLNNDGIINWGSSAKMVVLGNLNDTGFLNLLGGSSITVGGSFDGSQGGGVSIDKGRLTVMGNYAGNSAPIGGSLQLANGSLVTIGGLYEAFNDQISLSASTLSVGGTLTSQNATLTNGSVLRVGGDYIDGPNDLGTFNLFGGSSAFVGGFSNEFASSVNLDRGKLTIAGGFFGSEFSSTSIADSSVLNVGQGVSLTLGGASFALSGGSVGTVKGDFNSFESDVSIDDSILTVSGNFSDNEGQTTLTSTGKLVAGSYTEVGGLTDVSGRLVAGTYTNESMGATTIEKGGLIRATTFDATGGTVTVNGVLDPTAVEFGLGSTLQGKGTIIGNVAMGGAVIPGAPGTPGTLTIFGNYEQMGSGTLEELIGPLSQSLLVVNGDVALDANSWLQISVLNGFDPLNQTFSVIDYNFLVGQFANGSTVWDDGYLWNITYGQHEIDVAAVNAPEPSSMLLLGFGLVVLAGFAARKLVDPAKTNVLVS